MLGFDESLVYGARGGGNASSGGDSAAPAAVVEKVEEKTSFDVKIGAVDAKAKIKVIKEVRAITGLGLKEVSLFVLITKEFMNDL
jgi:large subunit ribosomal protein L7/L12